LCIDSSFSVKALAQLTYIDVLIQGINNPLHALVDSGAEICVAHKIMFKETEYEPCGKIRLRGIVGNSVETEVANVAIRMNDNRDCYVQVLCAICDE